MKIHVDSTATAFFEGSCAKKKEDRFDKNNETKRQGTVIRLFPCDEDNEEQYSEAADKRDKRAGRALAFAFLGCFLGAVIIDRFLVLSCILLVPSAIALVYGLWYELFG